MLQAFEILKTESFKTIPNLRFVFEGQEEVMSANLRYAMQSSLFLLLLAALIEGKQGLNENLQLTRSTV